MRIMIISSHGNGRSTTSTYETVSGSQPSGKTRSLEIYKDKENRYHVWEPKSLMNCIVHAVMMTVLALLALGMAFVAGKYLWR